MIPLPNDATPNDVEQWCSRGVVLVRSDASPNDPPRPAFYMSAASTSVEVQYLDGSTRIVPRTAVYVHWPRCGSVNIPGKPFAVHAARLAQRQYRRTFHVNGLSIVTPRLWDIARFLNGGLSSASVSSQDLAAACFNPVYPSLDEAEHMLTRESVVTVAVTPSIIIAGDRTGKRMFYFNGELVATSADGAVHSIGTGAALKRVMKLIDGRYYAYTNR